ncbi:MAG: 30S ribosomal protein S1 [Desulfuromonadia bacterium]
MSDERYDAQDDGGGEFARLLEESLKGGKRSFTPGDQVTATVLAIGDDSVFLNIGRKGEGIIDRAELLDDEGNLTVRVGDGVTAWFIGTSHGEMRFTVRMGKGGGSPALLEEAWRSGIPVEGVVEREIKGGYEIRLPGSRRGFCPFSAMGPRGDESPVAKSLSFLITQFGEQGRNIVLSHRAFLEGEKRRRRDELKERLAPGDRVEGRITSIQKFGVFVDIGGVDALIPLNELAWGRVTDPAEIVSVGERVTVTVTGINWERERITVSLKSQESDPWNDLSPGLSPGSYVTGTVSRLASFGAFVTLLPGVDGLIPVSRLSGGARIKHPRELLREGEIIEVTIESIDRENRRISLSPARERREREEEEQAVAALRASSSGSGALGTIGDLLKKKMEG